MGKLVFILTLFLVVVVDAVIYLFLGLLMMDYEDNYAGSSEDFGNLSTMNGTQAAIHMAWITWNVLNCGVIVYLLVRRFRTRKIPH